MGPVLSWDPDARCVRHGAGKAGEDVAVLGELDVLQADLAQLRHQDPREVELLGAARVGRRRVVGHRVDDDVAEEAREDVLRELLRERTGEGRRDDAHRRVASRRSTSQTVSTPLAR
jgi:hypothetical protein